VNFLDLILFLLLAFAAARGFRQGALSQVAAFGGAAAGLAIGALLAPELGGALVGSPGSTLALVTLAALLGCIFIGQAIGFAMGIRLRAAAAGAGAAPVDRTAGIAVGLLGLVLVVWLLAAALSQGPSSTVAHQIRESAVVSTINRALPEAPNVFARVGTYLDEQGFPQVFSGIAGTTAPPVDPPSEGAVAAAQQAGQASTVQIQALGCGGVSSGSGFVTQEGFIVTNAHVVAGSADISVRDASGTHESASIHFDPNLDLAVLSAPAATAPPIPFVATPSDRGIAGATLGYPGGQRTLNVSPAAVRERGEAIGRDIYGRGTARRDVLTLSANVRRGDSGGPFVTSEGQVGGVVFAAAPAEPGTGYALTAERVRGDVEAAIARNQGVGTGSCRF
jgi:S1-C subfamily serine protease